MSDDDDDDDGDLILEVKGEGFSYHLTIIARFNFQTFCI